ncbi:MAG TPA: DUF58 domain-containing protein [Streptosporangiaceae bacterium]|nr:DUF58 domain-containing protein [Streptosporangiaceae bacterium]
MTAVQAPAAPAQAATTVVAEAGTAADVDLTWAPTSHFRRLVTAGMLPLLAGLVLAHAGLLVLAAPALAALAIAGRRPRQAGRVSVSVSSDRCFEAEEITVTVRVEPRERARPAGARLVLPPALTASPDPDVHRLDDGGIELTWQVTALRWGRWDTAHVLATVRSYGGLWAGTVSVGLGSVTVFPRPPALRQLALPAELRTRIGDHVDRHAGDGVEFAGVRPFAAGDQLRRVNWAVSSRRGDLHVNQVAAERAAEVVVVIDALSDIGPAGETSLDRSVRGAAGLVRAYTRAGDRVGLITVYGPLRWIGPGTGQRQFFRIVESVVEVRNLHSYVSPDFSLIPRAALPPGALVVVLSPLLDQRALTVVTDLRERGYPVIIADVLATEPVPVKGSAESDLALRVWRLEREALHYHLESIGIPVVGWPGVPGAVGAPAGDAALDLALAPYARHRVRGGVR